MGWNPGSTSLLARQSWVSHSNYLSLTFPFLKTVDNNINSHTGFLERSNDIIHMKQLFSGAN